MKSYKNLLKIGILIPGIMLGLGCTKLDQQLGNTLTPSQASTTISASLLLQGAYNDLAGSFQGQDQVFSLEENSTDESLVPTRAGDWDDNGVWRVVHNHTWTADHSQVLNVFNSLNKINFDATNVLSFSPTAEQAAEARFLRAYALFYLLDLYGQFPIRNPGDNLLNPPVVQSGATAANFIISELNAVIPVLSASNGTTHATPDAAKVLLMHALLQRGAWATPSNPTFADADMLQVISLGQSIMSSGKYSYNKDYFANFNVTNSTSPELILAYPNTSGAAVAGGIPNSGPQGRWMMTLHYNSYGHTGQGIYTNAGWNGFSTISDFYNSFNPNQSTSAFVYGPADTIADTRMGGRYRADNTPFSGLRPGLLVGQQYDEKGVARVDRKGNPLAFQPAISPDMKETGNNLEITGIRGVKYVPDFSKSDGTYYNTNSGNWLVLMRYPDVVLMVAEAKMRSTSATDNAGALSLVNGLRAVRGATPFTTMTLAPTTKIVDDPANPNTLIGERGREFWWESYRRTDLIRFGLFNQIWQYKPTDDPHYLVYPIPTQALSSNPNLKQNPGY